MTQYCTIAEAKTDYGSNYIDVVCDRNLDGVVDTAAFNTLLVQASEQIDSYLLGRYALPLDTPPTYFRRLCVDIAVYNAATTADVLTENIEKRYERAIDYLKQIATNKVKLQLAPAATGENASASATVRAGSTLTFESGTRMFTRDTLKGLL